jgi:hypothetical protein
MLKIYTDYYRTYFSGITTLDNCMKRSSTAAFLQGLNDAFSSVDPSRRTLRDLLIAVRFNFHTKTLASLTNRSL